MTPDSINALFELTGALLICLNIRQLLRDRCVAGVHWAPTAFFTTWGLWNCYFYPSLDQWMSFCGGLAIVVTNAVWLGLVWRYRRDG